MNKILSVIGGLFLTIVLGVSGCAVGLKTEHEFQEGVFAQWRLIASAPQANMALARVIPCSFENENRQVNVVLIDTTGKAWQYDQCNGSEWQQTTFDSETRMSYMSYPCKIGDNTRFAPAESRLTEETADCWEVMWNWETFGIYSRYVLLRDGRIMSWKIGGDGVYSLLRGAGYGWFAGLLLAGIFLLRHKLFPAKGNVTVT